MVMLETLKRYLGNGWVEADTTCTYASADDPTYTMYISGNATTYLWAGMRFKCTQTTDRKFIITAVGNYDSGNNRTPRTLYGGTDFDLANATITNPYYSPVKCPYGFPMNPDKWSINIVDTASRIQTSPTNTTWYNLGTTNRQINIPIGVWEVYYKTDVWASATAGRIDIYSTLSTTSNGATDNDFTCRGIFNSVVLTGIAASAKKELALTAKQTYYLNYKVAESTSPTFLGSDGAAVATLIKATCAYL